MTFAALLLRNLRFHWRGHLAVLLGVALGSAVLTGALLVGDSLRGSLQDRADRQRCGVDYALVSPKFLSPRRYETPDDIAEEVTVALALRDRVETGIILRGSLHAGNDASPRSIQNATILGWFDPTDMLPPVPQLPWPWRFLPGARQDYGQPRRKFAQTPTQLRYWNSSAFLSASMARELGVNVGDSIRIRYPSYGSSPRESLLGRRESDRTQDEVVAKLGEIVPDDDPLAQFQLSPSSVKPRNILVHPDLLQQALSKSLGRKVESNAMFARNIDLDTLRTEIRRRVAIDDWGITVTQHANYVAIESRQTLLEPAVVAGVERTATDLPHQPTLVYLANSISAAGKEAIPYSVIAALDPTAPPPLGPFLPAGVKSLNDDEIVGPNRRCVDYRRARR